MLSSYGPGETNMNEQLIYDRIETVSKDIKVLREAVSQDIKVLRRDTQDFRNNHWMSLERKVAAIEAKQWLILAGLAAVIPLLGVLIAR